MADLNCVISDAESECLAFALQGMGLYSEDAESLVTDMTQIEEAYDHYAYDEATGLHYFA